jgi:hypothetical protein
MSDASGQGRWSMAARQWLPGMWFALTGLGLVILIALVRGMWIAALTFALVEVCAVIALRWMRSVAK